MLQKQHAQPDFRNEEVAELFVQPRKWPLDTIMAMQKALEYGIPEHDSIDSRDQKENRRKECREVSSSQQPGDRITHVPDIVDFLRKAFRRFFPRKNSESMTA